MRCFFGHKMKAVYVHHYVDNSYSRGKPGSPSSVVVSKCQQCGKIKHRILFGSGFIPLESLTKE